VKDKQTSSGSRSWLIGLIVIILLVTTIPYLLGYLNQGDHWRFSGLLFGVEDGNSYLAKMHTGLSGEWLFLSPYASPTQPGVLAFFPYIVLGKIAILPLEPQLQLVFLFQLFRWISATAMILATYYFSTMYFDQIKWMKWVTTTILLGGGLGWVLFFIPASSIKGWMPLSFISPESFGFLSLFGIPHLAMARALLLVGWIFFVGENTLSGSLKASLIWFLMALFQPLNVLVVWAVLFIYSLITTLFIQFKSGLTWIKARKILLHAGLPAISTAPIVAYYYFLYQNHPYFSAWKSQSFVLAPGVGKYILAYGLFLPFVMITLRKLIILAKPANRLLFAWGLAFPILISLPYNYQRRLAEGFWVVIVILAFLGISEMKPEFYKRWRWIFLLHFVGPLLLITGSVINVLNPASPMYQPAQAVMALNAVRKNTRANDVVLSSFETGNPLPAFAPVHVVLGHPVETVPYTQIKGDVHRVYQEELSQKSRKQILAKYHVDYVFWGPNERALGDWEPDPDQGYKLAFKKGKYHLYKIMFIDKEGNGQKDY